MSADGASSWKVPAKDIFAGTLAGTASILVVHPLDTIRTRLQTAERGRFSGPLDVTRQTLRNEGWRAFYKGLTPPLLTQGYQKAVMFFSYGAAQRFVTGDTKRPLTAAEFFACGAFAGGVNAVAACPVELVRNRLQVQYGSVAAGTTGSSEGLYRGPIDVLRKTVRTDGIFGLWRGLFPMLLRDVPGVGAWYATFELARRLLTPKNVEQKNVSKLRVMASGAMAGIGFWLIAFAQDSVKSVVQTRVSTGQKPLGFFGTAAEMMRTEGVFRLYRGLSVALLRGIPGASVTFLTYTQVRKAVEPL